MQARDELAYARPEWLPGIARGPRRATRRVDRQADMIAELEAGAKVQLAMPKARSLAPSVPFAR
jgi:hypothetical protein